MVFDLLFRVGPAIQVIFELGYEPKEEIFYELTSEQYNQLEAEGGDMSKKWYTIIPKNPKFNVPDLLVIDTDEKTALLDATKYINDCCNKEKESEQLATFEEKLIYLASKLPPIFSKKLNSGNTKNKHVPHLKIVK